MTPCFNSLKASYFTLGCKLNYTETSTIGRMLAEKGISRAAAGEVPDICIVNTCSVTETADKKGRNLIRKIASRYPEASIIVTGCYAQLKPQEVAKLPGVVLVVGSSEKLKIAEYLENWLSSRENRVAVTKRNGMKEFQPSCERGERTRFFLKIQDGCDYFCTYCTIPLARGGSRSGSVDQMVAMAHDVAMKGGKEIVLTGVNIGEFGKDNGESLFQLIQKLDKINGIERFRISSIEPNLLTDEMIRWIAEESRAFMPHFHIPLQSGSDRVLKLMNRKYDTALFQERIDTIKTLLPNAFIGVDVITGARGETEEEWERGLEFIRNLNISRLHVFPYSERPNTSALLLGDSVSSEKKKQRTESLLELSEEKILKFMTSFIGTRRKVLWEHPVKGQMMHGLTDNYLRVEAPFRPELINEVSEIIIHGIKPGEKELMTACHP